MPAFVRYPLLGCLALSLIACGSSGSQTLLPLSQAPGTTTPEAMRGAILNIYQATTQVTTTSSYRVSGSGSGTLGSSCSGTGANLTCTRYSDTGTGIVIESAHTADSGETPEGFGTSFRSIGTSQGIQLGTITVTATTGTGMDVEVMTEYYAGWLQNSFFAIVIDKFMEGGSNQWIGTAFSQGEATTTDPVALDGYDLTWKGKLEGLGHTTDPGGGVTSSNRIRGDVQIDVDSSTVDVTFSNLVDLNNDSNNERLNDLDWTWTGLSLSNGSFSGSDVNGRFYGDDHMEVGGTFDRHGAIGAFGARRMKSTTTQ